MYTMARGTMSSSASASPAPEMKMVPRSRAAEATVRAEKRKLVDRAYQSNCVFCLLPGNITRTEMVMKKGMKCVSGWG